MSDINDRIKELRKDLGLSQTEFGKRIGVSLSVIHNLETKITEPKPLLIEQIIKTYAVDQKWLETGEGEMYAPIPSEKTEFDTYHLLISDLSDDKFKKRIYNALMTLTDAQWHVLEEIVTQVEEVERKKKETASKKEEEGE